MNAILFHTDQERADLPGCYGNPLKPTPVLDRLAAEGIRFTNAFTPCALCAPARAAFLTGTFPLRNGIIVNPESGLPGGKDFTSARPTLGNLLRDRGCLAAHWGKWHAGTRLTPKECGFDGPHFPGYGHPYEHPDYLGYLRSRGLRRPEFRATLKGRRGHELAGALDGPAEASEPHYLAERAIETLEFFRKEGKPFFLRLDFWGPHLPCFSPEPWHSMFKPSDIPASFAFADNLADKPRIMADYRRYWGVEDFGREEWSRFLAAYYGCAAQIDAEMGRVISAAEAMGLLRDTALFFITDHGESGGCRGLCDKGPWMTDECYRIPMVAWRPGCFKQGLVDDSFVYHFDFMPTILETCGAPVPAGLDAVSLLPNLTGSGRGRNDDAVFGESHGHQAPFEQRMVRSRVGKYVFNCSDRDEFYDLNKDPHELVNRIDDPGYRADLREARERLARWMAEKGDPLLKYFRSRPNGG